MVGHEDLGMGVSRRNKEYGGSRFMLAGSSPQARSPYASLDVRLTNETLVPQQLNERYGIGTNTNTEAFRAGTLIEMR